VLISFYALHDFDFIPTETAVRGLACLGGGLAIVALYHIGEDYVVWLDLVDAAGTETGLDRLLPPSVPRITGVGDHVNILAMAFNLTLPFALALLFAPLARRDRWLGGLTALLVLTGLFFTVSRGAWLATLVALPVFFTLCLLRGRDLSRLLQPLQARRSLVIALAGVSLIAGVAGVAGVSRWESRPEWLFRSSLSPRYDAAEVALDIVRDRPWLGAGPYTYPLLYNVYSGRYPIENIHPHNGYLATLVDIGVVGAVVVSVGALIVVSGLWQAYRGGDSRRRVLVAACAAALVSLAVHALVDTPNAWSTALLPLAAVLAVALRLIEPPPPRATATATTLSRGLVVAILPLLIGGWVYLDSPHSHYEASLDALRAGHFLEAASEASKAASDDTTTAGYQIHAGVMSAIVYVTEMERGREPPALLLDEAVSRFRRAIADDPRGAIGHANLAIALRLKNDKPGAAEAARTALARAPTDAAIAAVTGTVLEWAGFQDEAFFAYSRAVSHDAGLVQSPFWSTSPARTNLRDDALDVSELTACEKGRVTAIYRGYPDDLAALETQCRAHVESNPVDARARSDLSLLLYAQGRRDEALREAETAVQRVPDNPFVRTAYAVSLIPKGDIDRVRQELTLGSYLGDPDASLLLAYTYQPPDASNPVLRNLGLPSRSAPMPREVYEQLQKALGVSSPMVFDNGVQRYLLGILYHRVRFLRESPSSILIPGEWISVASPRALLILEALRGGSRAIE
jgi:O-antigen ligase/tetratricopeptide (TPR) repeat protein